MHQVQIFPAPGAGAIVVFDTRESIEEAVAALIERLDAIDGDPDLEPNGDELDGSLSEEDFYDRQDPWGAAGCPVGDPGEQEWRAIPRFGIDQTTLPTNIREEERVFALAQLEPDIRAMQRQ